jgi:hypothetical protein
MLFTIPSYSSFTDPASVPSQLGAAGDDGDISYNFFGLSVRTQSNFTPAWFSGDYLSGSLMSENGLGLLQSGIQPTALS